jgi:hypothetical protein
MSLAPVLIFTVGFSMMGMGMISVTGAYDKGANKAAKKWQSNQLAETGANVLYDRIRQQMINDGSYPFVLNNTEAKATVDGNLQVVGTYSANLIKDREVLTDISGQRQYTYYFTIEAKGQAKNGVESLIQTRFKATMAKYLVPKTTATATVNPTEFGFPTGAIVSNADVKITTNQGLRTYSPSGTDAHVIANDGIVWEPASGSKSTFINPSILDIQGYWLTPDGGPYTLTTGNGGIGNSNGTVNYRSPVAPPVGDFPGAAANTVIKLEGPTQFADEGTVETWRKDWQDQASKTGATIHSKGVDSASVAFTSGVKRLQSPATINGDLNIADGDKLELFPYSKDPRKNVVYVKGDVKNLGQLVNHGVTLVFEGKYSDDKDAEYKLEPDALTFKTREEVLMKSSLMSLSKSRDSMVFNTNSSSTTGLVYSLRGGIEAYGTPEFSGMLLAGGVSDSGGIKIEPEGGNSFVVKYEPYAATGGALALDSESVVSVEYVPGNVSYPFSPTKLYQWLQLK